MIEVTSSTEDTRIHYFDSAMKQACPIQNCVAVTFTEIPLVTPNTFLDSCRAMCAAGGRIAALCVLPQENNFGNTQENTNEGHQLLAVIARDTVGDLMLLRCSIENGRYPALTPILPQAQAFEREIFEEKGITPEGHPWLKPLRRHAELETPTPLLPSVPIPHPFFQVNGTGIHEVAVGPVHAGIIEPGHFRFQCFGESVLHLEIQLGYQHRGIEHLFPQLSSVQQLAMAESIAGDTAIGHGLAYCMVIEALAGVKAPLAANKLRGIALEIERLANHVGDLGALCNDVGYLPGASWFGRLRGEFLNMLLQISGNRFGRGLQKPGGVRYALSDAKREALLHRLIQVENDLQATAKTALDAASVQSRFEGTGKISRPLAVELGLVGPVARASGCERDVRCDHPNDFYRLAHIQVAKHDAGDVMARAQVRWLEAQQSIRFIRDQLAKWPEEPLSNPVKNLLPNQLALALVEGWRGEILHLALTGKHGEMLAYKIVDPSFHNWFGLALALRYNQISDFPLCNKSFNLSYAGHDL